MGEQETLAMRAAKFIRLARVVNSSSSRGRGNIRFLSLPDHQGIDGHLQNITAILTFSRGYYSIGTKFCG